MTKRIFLAVFLAAVFVLPVLAEKVVLQYWASVTHPTREQWRDKMIEAFNNLYSDIEVRILRIPFAEYFTKLAAAFAAGTGPDVFEVDCTMTPRYVWDGVLVDLTPYFENELADFLEASLAEGMVNGKLYAIPLLQSSQAIFYNKKMFQELGIEPPTDPDEAWTWEQVVEVAKKLTKDLDGDGEPDIWGIIVEKPDRLDQINPLLESKGATLISPDGKTVMGYLNSAPAIEALAFYGKWYNEWKISPKISTKDLFGMGKAAMMWAGPWNIRWLQETYPDLEWGVMPHPYFEGGRKVTPCGAWHLGVYSKSNHIFEAIRFVGFMSDWSAADLNYEITNYLPARKSTYTLYNIFNTYPMNIFAKQLFTTASPRPRTPAYLEYEEILREAYRNVINGADAAAELNRAAMLIEKVLQRYTR